jgi:dTDP-4-amino-4,6-dideoxygalactose transaminase
MIPISKPVIGPEEIRAVERVLRSGVLTQGTKVKKFEGMFAAYIGVKYAVATNSGTSALHVALLSSGIRAGDEVITTPFSFVAAANAILYTGARPVFADIDEATFNIDPEKIGEKITNRTKALLVVHLFGQPCDMKRIMKICEKNGLILIEDACQAHGAEFDEKKVGSFGTGCFSFYPSKNLVTGEGGMITTNDKKVAEKAKMIRNHGQTKAYVHDVLGYNYRMTDIAAAIGICQLRKLDALNKKRVKNAELLTKEIEKIDGLIPPRVMPSVKHVFHQYTIRVTEDFGTSRDELKQRLGKKGIDARVYYPIPIHKQPLYKKLGYRDKLPISEKAANEVLSLPVHPSLTEGDMKKIVGAIK